MTFLYLSFSTERDPCIGCIHIRNIIITVNVSNQNYILQRSLVRVCDEVLEYYITQSSVESIRVYSLGMAAPLMSLLLEMNQIIVKAILERNLEGIFFRSQLNIFPLITPKPIAFC